MNWIWSDAWLLMSIISNDKKGTDLRGIISTGDYINRSIFSFDELRAGLEKLMAIDYVRMDKDRFFVTPAFTHDCKKLKIPKAMLKAVDQLYELLKTKSMDETEIKPLDGDVISEIIYKNACENYLKEF